MTESDFAAIVARHAHSQPTYSCHRDIGDLIAELRQIDCLLARRPALDKPTRWENIQHAINTAAEDMREP